MGNQVKIHDDRRHGPSEPLRELNKERLMGNVSWPVGVDPPTSLAPVERPNLLIAAFHQIERPPD